MTQTTPANQSAYCFPAYVRPNKEYEVRRFCQQISKHIEAGGGVYMRFKEGARAGSIARIHGADFSSFETLYQKASNTPDANWVPINREWELKWDDRKNVVKWYVGQGYGMEVVFDAPGTDWKFVRNPDTTEQVENFDHFGKRINIGDVCMFVYKHGKNDFRLRFGKLTRTSKVGTMWFKPFRTAKNHPETEADLLVSADLAKSVTILDDDVRRKVMMSKLAL